MTSRLKAPGWLAVLVGVFAYIFLSQIRRLLAPDAGSATLVAQSLDASFLYVICLVPGFLAASLNSGRWWIVGGLAGYLAEVARAVLGLALVAAGHPDAPSIGEPLVASLIHAIPNAIFGIAGAALARVPIFRGGQ